MASTFDLNDLGKFLSTGCKLKSKEDISDLVMYHDFYGAIHFKSFIEFLAGFINSCRLVYDERYISMTEESVEHKMGVSIRMDGRLFPIYDCENKEKVVVPLSTSTLLTHLKSVKVGTKVQMYSEKGSNNMVININGGLSTITTIPINEDIPTKVLMRDEDYICSGALQSLIEICEGFKNIACNEANINIYRRAVSIIGDSKFGGDDKTHPFGLTIENDPIIDTFRYSADLFKKLIKLKGISNKSCVQFFYKKQNGRAYFQIIYQMGGYSPMELYFFKDEVVPVVNSFMYPVTPLALNLNLKL